MGRAGHDRALGAFGGDVSTYANPGRQYEAVCALCRQRSGQTSAAEANQWLSGPCPKGGQHYGTPLPVYLPGTFLCLSCVRPFARIAGDRSTETTCDKCVSLGRPARRGLTSPPQDLPCGAHPAFSAQDLFGGFSGHYWRTRFRGRQGWSCCTVRRTFDPLSGDDASACGRTAVWHAYFPDGMTLPGGESCGMVCLRCSNALAARGARLEPAFMPAAR